MSKNDLDAHEKPPEALSSLFKHYRALSRHDLEKERLIIDFSNGLPTKSHNLFSSARHISVDELRASFSALGHLPLEHSKLGPVEVFELRSMPGGSAIF